MNSFVSELKRRNVLRVAAAYALVAWILIEAGSVLLPTFGAPEWFFKIYVIIVVAGFVVSLIIAWIFEVTPDGVKLERDIDRTNYEPQQNGRLNGVLIGLLVFALMVSLTFNITGMRDRNGATDTEPAYNSIAVLPFESRSSDNENQYFADGIHNDILTRLAEVESLRVISRTSVNEYRGTARNMRQIGEELNVATILEGAVQRSGDQVRVTVQLIDAARDEPIWGDTFDRQYTLQNVFELQTAIAARITGALQAALTPEQESRLASVPTENTEAYVEYVKGTIDLMERRFESLQNARREFSKAIELDPDYAQAHSRLAETTLILYSNHAAIPADEALQTAAQHIDIALRLDPDLANAYAARGLLEMTRWTADRIGDGNRLAAASFEEALRLNPNLSDAYVWFASLRSGEGKMDDAINLLTQALTIDPRSRIPYVNLPSFLARQGQNREATELLLEAIRIFPEWETPYQYLSNHMQGLGRLDEAVAWGLQARSRSADPMAANSLVPIYQEFGDDEAISEFIHNFPADHPLYPIGRSYWHYALSEYEASLAALEELSDDDSLPMKFYAPLRVGAAIMIGDFERAYGYLVDSNPALAPDAEQHVDAYNVQSAILLAFIQQKRDLRNASRRLLEKAEPVVRNMPRLGMSGHGIRDVHILTLLGRHRAALDALAEAVEEGFVSSQMFDVWAFNEDPIIEPLRSDPRFDSLKLEIDRRVDAMRQNVETARQSDDWSPLLARAGST